MYEWLDNGFVLKNLFGESDVFVNSVINNVNWQYISGRLTLSIYTNSMFLKPPKDWKMGYNICINIDFVGVTYTYINLHSDLTKIDSYSFSKIEDKNLLEFKTNGTSCIKFKFTASLLQNVKPIP